MGVYLKLKDFIFVLFHITENHIDSESLIILIFQG